MTKIKNKKLYIETKKLIEKINYILKDQEYSSDITNVIFRQFEIIKNSDEYKICYNILDSFFHVRANNLEDFIYVYYLIVNKPLFDRKIFYSVYKDLESYIYEKNIFIAISPLENFSSDYIKKMTLKTNPSMLEIRKVDENNQIRNNLIKSFEEYGINRIDFYSIQNTKFFLLLEYEVPNALFSNERPSVLFTKFLLALRIFKNGNTDIRMTLHRSLTRNFMDRGYFASSNRHMPSGAPYELNKKDIKNFKKFWKFFSKRDTETQNSLNLAIRRLNFGYNRIGAYDKIIDYMVGFESLFGGGEGEQRYKIALRTAFLIKKNSNEIEKIFETMKKAYTIRSKILHGASDNEIKKIEISVPELEDYLRRSIIILLQKKFDDSKTIANFTDNLILKNKIKTNL